jgi:hypothetical protein
MDEDERSSGTSLLSIRSTNSLLSIGSFFSVGSALSAASRWSLMSWRSVRGSMDAEKG